MTRLAIFAVVLLALGCDDGESRDDPPPPVAPEPATPTPTEPAPVTPVTPTPTAPPAATGIQPGATGMAAYRGEGFLYAAVVTERQADGRLTVVYADGDSETIDASGFKPDRLGVGTRVEARIRAWPRFFPGHVARRIGHALFIEFDDGDRQWTSIGLVRIAATDVGPNATAVDVETPTARSGAPGSTVVANYRGEGRWYAGVVAERRSEDGKLHVIYADGDSEWVDPGMVRPDTLRNGAQVETAVRREGNNQVLQGSVLRRVGHAVEVGRSDGTTGWSALANTRLPH